MFRDKEEELARLEEQLLEDEPAEEETEEYEEDFEEEEEAFLEEPSGDTSDYKNFANDYGHVDAYNADKADLDLEDYSEEVYTPSETRKDNKLLYTIFLLLAAIFLVLAWWVARYTGVL
ncbi:MAG: hypothetical protein IKU57_04645 [Oscillospiraceae bacterium]|nr:hypothetical protein [Oscillospiraceae bacterium]